MQQENGARGQAAWMKSAYEKFLEEEGIPVYDTLAAVFDVTELPRKPWPRTGGLGTYITMVSTTDAMRGIYVAEIPGGGALNPERHLFEEGIWILQGRGAEPAPGDRRALDQLHLLVVKVHHERDRQRNRQVERHQQHHRLHRLAGLVHGDAAERAGSVHVY